MGDRLLGLVCFVVGLSMLWFARSYEPAYSYEPLGPSAFPQVLGVGLMVCGVWLLISRRAFSMTFQHIPWVPTLVCAVSLMAYALLFQVLGFVLATTFMAVPVGMTFGGSWKKSLLGGAVLGIALFVLFDKVLDVTLPALPLNPLGAVFGG